MIEYISGKIAKLSPTIVIIDNAGIGYAIEISLQTYDALNNKTEAKVYIQRQLNQRDGTEVDYGFATYSERELFRMITGVTGIGAASARMILSSMSTEELRECIISEDANRLKSVKGIGLKSAQRLILELKDKMLKDSGEESSSQIFSKQNDAIEQASNALQLLGFPKANVNKAIQTIIKQSPSASVEEIIKAALKIL